jgi:hypothetical protein
MPDETGNKCPISNIECCADFVLIPRPGYVLPRRCLFKAAIGQSALQSVDG